MEKNLATTNNEEEVIAFTLAELTEDFQYKTFEELILKTSDFQLRKRLAKYDEAFNLIDYNSALSHAKKRRLTLKKLIRLNLALKKLIEAETRDPSLRIPEKANRLREYANQEVNKFMNSI